MNKYLLNTIGVAILALIGTTTWAVWEWGGVGQTTKTDSLALVQKMDKILDVVGRPETGTIAEIDKTILGTKSLIVHADLVARHEQQQLTTWDDRGTTLFVNVNGAISDARATLRQSTETLGKAGTDFDKLGVVIDKFSITEDQLNALLQHGWKLVDDADSLVLSPQTHDLLDGMVKTSQNTAGMTSDMHTWLHEKLFPAPYTGRFKNLHRIYVIGKGFVTLAEPTYYGAGIFNGLK